MICKKKTHSLNDLWIACDLAEKRSFVCELAIKNRLSVNWPGRNRLSEKRSLIPSAVAVALRTARFRSVAAFRLHVWPSGQGAGPGIRSSWVWTPALPLLGLTVLGSVSVCEVEETWAAQGQSCQQRELCTHTCLPHVWKYCPCSDWPHTTTNNNNNVIFWVAFLYAR